MIYVMFELFLFLEVGVDGVLGVIGVEGVFGFENFWIFNLGEFFFFFKIN